MPGRRLERKIEAQVEIAIRIEPLDAQDVGDGGAGGEVVPVRGREGIGVAGIERRRLLLPPLLDERVVQVVGPGSRGLRESRLDLGHVVVLAGAGLAVDHDVQAREHGLGDAGAEVEARAAEGVAEDVLDPPADLRVVALEWEEHEAGDEAAEHVAPHEEADAPPLSEVQDRERGLVQVVLVDLEELVARDTSRGSGSAPCSRGCR